MRPTMAPVRGLLLSILTLVLVSCGGGSTITPTGQQVGGELDIVLRPLSAVQNSPVIPIQIFVPPTGGQETVPAYIHVGFRVGPAADAPLRLMTAAAGSLDLNHRSTIVDIPPAGLELTFFWDALQDLGADADLDAVTIRAGILRANGTDPREAVCDFQPVVAISFGSTLACTSEAPMLDGETLVQGAPGSPYSDQLEVSGGEPPLRFEVIDPTTGNPRLDSNIGFGLTLDPATGLVSGTIDPAAPPVITFIARVIDACSTEPTGQRAGSQVALIPGGRFDQALFTVPIEPITAQCDAPAPQLTTTALPNGEVGVPYEFQLEATGGVGTLSFSAEGLPAEDLSIDSNGRIAGTPTAPGTFTVVATVRDSCEFPQEDTETLTLTVDCGAAPSFGGAATLPDAFVGQSYDQSFPVEFPNGAGSLQITAGVLPEGLSLSTETARNTVLVRISGIPTSGEQAGQTFNFTLTATDTCPSGGLTTNRDLSITLRDIPACPEPAPDITTTTLPDGVAGEPYSATIDVTGGTLPVGPVTIIDNGGLDSLTIQPDGRTLAGNLPEGSEGAYSLVVQVADACSPTSRTDQATLELTITASCPSLAVGTTSLPNAVVGGVYDEVLAPAGGVGPFAWEIIEGGLPSELTLGADGRIQGTVSAAPGEYPFRVRVTDACASGAQTAEADLTITVVDIPCGLPVVTPAALENPTLGEEYSAAIEATGGVAPYTFSLRGGGLPSGLTLDADGRLTGTPDNPKDIGVQFDFVVEVADSCSPTPGTDTESFSLTVQPPACPALSITNVEFPDPIFGTPYSEDLVGTGVAPLTWSLRSGSLPAGISVDPSGTLGGTATNPDEVGQEFSFTLQVTDSCEGGPQTAQADFTFTLQPAACVPPTITTKALPDPVLDEPYSAAVEATGGIAPYGFTLVAGALPSGLTLNPDGTLTGSADDSKEVGQAFTFTVEVADSCTPTPATDTQEYTITVRPAPCVPAEITNTGFPDPVLNQAYNASLLATGEAPFTWQLLAGTLPTGLTVDPAGFLRGTPSAVNEVGRAFTFTLEVTDACPQGPQSAQAEFTVTLQGEVCTNPDIQTTDLDDPVLGTPYTARIQATGGVTPYTFAIDAGVLPRGLTLGSNGTITGTPDNPEEIGRDFTFDVRVTDSCTPTPGFDVQSLIMTLQPAACAEIRITNEGFADPVLGEVYSADLTAEGEAPFTWSLVAGSLPTGLAVDPAGTITGTPTDPAQVNRPFTFTLQVADSCLNGPQTAQAEFTVTLQPAPDCTDPVILTTELPNPTFGQPYMARIETTDGVEPYTFALIGGALPAGLDLDPLGAITGTPNDAEEIGQEFPFTVQVTDSCPFTPGTDTQDLVIVVQPAPCEPLAIANTGFADPVLGQAYNATLFATGGVPPYAWALASTSGPLPSGLTVDPSGAIMGTPDDPEQVGRPFTFTLEATDACPLGAQTSQAEFTVTLQPAPDCPDPAITTTELANPVLGEPYNQPLEVAGGEAPFTFEVLKGGVLPTGIALSSEGVLSGTPENLEEVGIQFSFTVQVTDSCEFGAGVDTESYTITLQPEPCTDLVILNTGFADPVLGQAYNASLLADGEPPFIWEFLDGSLPAGLTVEPEGILGGTPTDPKEVGQEFTFTLQVSDVCNDVPRAVEGTFTFTLQPAEACDPPVIQDPEATDPVFGQEYLLQFTATGGVEPYTWSLDEGVLPEGLSFTPEGTITGTPTDPNQVGIRFPVQVQVADNCPFAPGTDTFDLLLVVQPPDCEPAAVLNTGFGDPVLGQAYNATLFASGEAPFTWEIAEGSLPRGITLDPGGSLNGTPDDPEEVGVEFTFTLRVTDSCLIPQTAEGTFSVTLQPAPACDPVAITTPELPDAFLGEAYDATVEAAGGQPPYDFDLASGSLPSGITLSGSGALTGTPTNLEEVGTTFVVGVRVTDSCPFTPGTDIRNYSLTLFERCQPLAITTEELPDPTFGLDYSVALDSSGGSGTLTWSLEEGRLPSGLTLTPQGTLDGVPDNESQVGEEFSFTVRVADECPQGAQSDLQDYTIILQPNCTDPVITTESLPDATLLEPYNVQLEVAGGTGPFTWTVEPEDLPTGLTLNPDGSITGTPTNPEEIGREFLIDVEVTDSCPLGPRSDTARLPLQLLAPCEPLNITNTGFANPVLGQAYNATLFATGEPPLEWSLAAGSLPSGMSVDPEGTLGGTPNDPKQVGQTFNFTLAVTDSCVAGPQLDTAEFQFTLLPPVPCGPVSITTTDLPDFIFGEPYNQAVQATGGQPPYIWDLVEGSLPDGITFNEATGVLSGTPTNPKQVNSEWFLFIRVQDSCPFNPTFDDVDLQIDLHGPDCNGPVSITTTDLADFVFGEPYSESVEATGGLPPYRWELVESALPDGITFDGDSGTFSGTPNNPQQINTEWIFHVRVTDSCVIPTSDQQVLLVDLHGPDCNGPVTITTTDLPDFRFGEPYSEAVQATGGLQPYTWELVEGGLPSGITFNEATGTFEGTPDDPEQIDSEWFFQVRVTDACVIPTSDDVTLFIDLHGPTCTDRNFTFLTEGLPRATFGVPYNAQLEVSGGLAPYTFEAIDGTPPAGLTLNPDGSITGTITDPNQVGRHFFTVRATDACVLPNVAIRDFMILVDPPNCQEIGIQNTGFPDPILGTPYNATLFASGEPPFTWSLMAGSLPDGMSVDPTGAITGTPNNPQQISGTFTFTIRVEDSCAIPQFDFQQYSFTLQPAFCPELGILFMDYPDPILNQPYNEPLEAEGFPPFTWQLAPESNPMPTGMFIDPEGFITGTPTNPQEIGREFGFRVQVTDSCPNGPQTGFTTVRFILESCPPVNITTTGLPAPELGQYYEQPLMAAGGQQPYTWSLVGGSLPTGLHLDPTGRILGTPMNPNEAQFTFTFTVQVTDSCNPMSSDQQQFQVSLQIGGCFPDPFVIVNAGNIGDAVFQQPFTYRFFSDGGYPTYGWFLASGTLPTGLSLHPLTGVLSGTPSNPDQVGDTFVFEIQVQSSGCKEVTPVTRVVMRVVPSGG